MATRMIKDVHFNVDPSGNDYCWTQLFTAKEFLEYVNGKAIGRPKTINVDSPKGNISWSRFVDIANDDSEYSWVYWCEDLGGWYLTNESLSEWKRAKLVKYLKGTVSRIGDILD